MNVVNIIIDCLREDSQSKFENILAKNEFTPMKYAEYERMINTLMSLGNYKWVLLVSSYFGKIVSSNTSSFFHVIMPDRVSGSAKDMIQCYKYIKMYNNFIDCSQLLTHWSPTESYFPVLTFIHSSNPEKQIDFTYWLRRFSKLPDALRFLKNNNIKIDFTEPKDLADLYTTIPEMYIKDFLDLLGSRSWYMQTIKDTDHFTSYLD